MLFLRMLKIVLPLLSLLLFVSCTETSNKKNAGTSQDAVTATTITHANGFTIKNYNGYKTITLTNPWPGAETTFTYALVDEDGAVPEGTAYDAVVRVPLQSIVVTSTTHIPSLEMLDVADKLVGFPNLKYISSAYTRDRISDGRVKELGKNESINTEVLIDLEPDAVITFAVQGDNKTVATIQKTGIPVLYNADWTETTPLGKAEWIKFFGALFNKEKEAEALFDQIKRDYETTKKIAETATSSPTVMSGAMYKDVWYLPQGDSWAAQFIADANAHYLWAETEGTGSLSLHIESVLEKGQHASYWIGPGQFTSKQQMQETHPVYSKFDAFKNDKVYSFTTKKGATGGVVYYELAPNRPDLVLADMVKILHPDLLPEHELYFFTPLD